MSQLVFIHVGQAGINIGDSFWNLIYKQHMTENGKFGDLDLSQNINWYFNENLESESYSPRWILVDSDITAIDHFKWNSSISTFIDNDWAVSWSEASAGNYIRAAYVIYREVSQQIENAIRKQSEQCDEKVGFIITNSVTGGTGAGIGDRICDIISSNYDKHSIFRLNLLPSDYMNETIWGYNTILSLSEQSQKSENLISICFDNTKLFDITKSKNAWFKDINDIIAIQIRNILAPIEDRSINMQTIQTNMLPFSRALNFTRLSYANSLSSISHSVTSEACGPVLSHPW